MNTIGENIKISLFGESHGKGIGISIDGLPAGMEIPHEKIKEGLKRRNPRNIPYSTKRWEEDEYEILAGEYNGKTNGYPLVFYIYNKEVNSKDAEIYKLVPRPGHADYPAYVKYQGMADLRGGGEFSGRMTVAMVIAGELAKHLLISKGIEVHAYTKQIGNISTTSIEGYEQAWKKNPFSVPDEESYKKMLELVKEVYEEGDSIGGMIECITSPLPIGLGNPFFGSMESTLSSLLFSIPGIKGIFFGDALEIYKGSQFNDYIEINNNQISLNSNHSGGINGGLTNGNPIKLSVIVRPPASIYKPMKSVNIEKKENVMLELKGRYDPCIVPRAVVVVEDMVAIAILDKLMEVKKI